MPFFISFSTGIAYFIDYLIYIVGLVIPLLLGLAVLVFMWGIVKFIAHAEDEKTHEEGKQLMVYGMIGLFVIVSLWGIVGFLHESLGLTSFATLGSLPEQSDTIPTP
mgnify:FL=1